MRNKQTGDVGIVIIVLIVLIILAALVHGVYFSINHHTVTFTINKSERVSEGKTARYLIFTDNNVYQNSDSLLNNKFNSSDLYNQLVVGKKYTCDAVGYRNGFFSAYENLITCKETK